DRALPHAGRRGAGCPRRRRCRRDRCRADSRAGAQHRRAGAGAGAGRAHLFAPRAGGGPALPQFPPAGCRGRRMSAAMNIVILGLSLSSSWGNGHATTYRALIPGLVELGHTVHFLERDVPWYAENRDLPDPGYCHLGYYAGPSDLLSRYGALLRRADAVVVGSYVPDGAEIIDLLLTRDLGHLSFYDIDTPVTLAKLEQ